MGQTLLRSWVNYLQTDATMSAKDMETVDTVRWLTLGCKYEDLRPQGGHLITDRGLSGKTTISRIADTSIAQKQINDWTKNMKPEI